MASTNLSIVDSLIRSHFSSASWTKSSDINFFNDERITHINMYFKELPVKSKLYILMALGNLDHATFIKWKDDVESLFLRAMVEGNLLVRAIATILQHKFSLNYLTFDISMSLETFSDVLVGLKRKINEWDTGYDISVVHYLSPNVVNDLRKRRNINPNQNEIDKRNVISCKFRKTPKSVTAKADYLKKLEFECNKKRISVPIPGRSKIWANDKNDADVRSANNRESILRSVKQTERQRKDLEIDAKLEDWRRRHHQKQQNEPSVASQKRDKGLICLSIDEMPISGPRARQIQREKDREAKKIEKEERARRLKEEKEAEKIRKFQEKERMKIESLEQRRLQKEEQEKLKRKASSISAIDQFNKDEEDMDDADNDDEFNEDQDLVAASIAAENSAFQPPAQQVRVIHPDQFASFNNSVLPSSSVPNIGAQLNNPVPQQIRIINPQQLQQMQQQTNLSISQIQARTSTNAQGSQIVLIRPNQQQQQIRFPLTTISAPGSTAQLSAPNSIRLIRVASNQVPNQVNTQPATTTNPGQRIVRLITPSTIPNQPQQQQFISITNPVNEAAIPTIQTQTSQQPPQHQEVQIQQPQPVMQQTSQPPPQQQQSAQQATPYLEEMRMLVKYANRLTRPQKAMIVSFLTRTADGVDFQGHTSVHMSTHRAVNYETVSSSDPNSPVIHQPQPLNLIIDTYFYMNYHTNEWYVTKRYREPQGGDDELLRLDLQPYGYPPTINTSSNS